MSSLQHNIPRCLVLVFWNLLKKSFLFCDVIVFYIKKVLLENESSLVMGGALTFFPFIALFSVFLFYSIQYISIPPIQILCKSPILN